MSQYKRSTKSEISCETNSQSVPDVGPYLHSHSSTYKYIMHHFCRLRTGVSFLQSPDQDNKSAWLSHSENDLASAFNTREGTEDVEMFSALISISHSLQWCFSVLLRIAQMFSING